MIADWLIVVLVFAVLWLFWIWLGLLFDAITEYHAALRERDVEGDAEARQSSRSEKATSALPR